MTRRSLSPPPSGSTLQCFTTEPTDSIEITLSTLIGDYISYSTLFLTNLWIPFFKFFFLSLLYFSFLTHALNLHFFHFLCPLLDLVSSLFTGSNTFEVIINSEIVQQIIRLFRLASTFSYQHLMLLRVYKCSCTVFLFHKQTNDCFPVFKQTVVKLRFNRRKYAFVSFYSVLDFNYRRQTLKQPMHAILL